MTRIPLLSTLAVAMLAFVGCGTETGNPELLSFEYNATSSAPARVRLGESQGSLGVERVWLRLGDVGFVDCDGQREATLQGIGLADHGGTEAAVQTLEVDLDRVCAIESRFYVEPDATDEPPSIQGAAIALQGELADGRRFEVVVDETITVELPITSVSAGRLEDTWLMAFDVATWLGAVDLDMVPDDPVVVDALSHPELYSTLIEAIPDGVLLVRDLDHDGQVDADEPSLRR